MRRVALATAPAVGTKTVNTLFPTGDAGNDVILGNGLVEQSYERFSLTESSGQRLAPAAFVGDCETAVIVRGVRATGLTVRDGRAFFPDALTSCISTSCSPKLARNRHIYGLLPPQ